uniref:molybdopterin biosynthesis protein n=1 Tax=Madagascaria erythrocladioides TaxID=753684 RepID=UPI001BEF561E|nr:molybdopterin biosynthesis protein [Madagascaria erythrocladioides]QUE29104.1 moeB [Madagascaria erythrocladioides]UNJ16659.1 molybdopterin biosynthesis protein [Madagascaria erythrocladioides]
MLNPDLRNIEFSLEEYKRYTRNLVLSEIGLPGQKRIKASKILCVGAGGLASPIIMYLSAVGVGRIGIIDFDVVSLSNLQRQVLYTTCCVGSQKVLAAKTQIQSINPNCSVETYITRLTEDNASIIMSEYDIVVDASDNFPTRYLLSDISCLLNKPLVYGAILQSFGQISVFNYKGGVNYRDLYTTPPPDNLIPSCSEGGVIGGVAAVIGSLQANEVLKIILGIGKILSGKLLVYDFLNGEFKTLRIKKKNSSNKKNIAKLMKKQDFYEVFPNFSMKKFQQYEITADNINFYLNSPESLLVDVRSVTEFTLAHIENAINIPLSLLKQDNKLMFLRNKIKEGHTIVIYCQSDSRSFAALSILLDFSIQALRIKGGFDNFNLPS